MGWILFGAFMLLVHVYVWFFSRKTFLITYGISSVIWLMLYDTGFGGWLFITQLSLLLVFLIIMCGKPSLIKAGAAGIGGYVLGRKLAKM